MSATLSVIRHRFWNNDGTVCAGGKAYIYEPGTSTLKSNFTDWTGTVENTNPVILNAKGEPQTSSGVACDIWTTGPYKINLLQSDDVQVTGYPVDGIGTPVVLAWNDRGNFNASVNTYPTTGGSGTAGAIEKGDLWTISVVATSGVLNGKAVGTTVRALRAAPGQTVAYWETLDVGLGASNAAAVAAAAAAAVSAANALTSENNAGTSETNAGTSETNAAASAASALAYAVAMSLNATTDTSASSITIPTTFPTSKTFTVSAGKSFVPSQFLIIGDTAAPTTNWMVAQVTSYSGTTLIVSVLSSEGSGTIASWNISQTSAANPTASTLNSGMVTIASHATTADIFAAAANTIIWDNSTPATCTAFQTASKAGIERTLLISADSQFTNGANLKIHGLPNVGGNTVTLPAGSRVIAIAKTTTEHWLFPESLEGTFTATGTGFSSGGTASYAYSASGGVIHISRATLTGNSNSTGFTITGFPTPDAGKAFAPLAITDAGVTSASTSWGSLATNGTLALYTTFSAGGWNAAGVKELLYGEMSYDYVPVQ